MTNFNPETQQLIDRYLAGKCSPEECLLVERVYYEAALKKTVEIEQIDFNKKGLETWKEICSTIQEKPSYTKKIWLNLAAVASILIFIAAGTWFFVTSRSASNVNSRVSLQNDISPAKSVAVLTLANGKSIKLSELQKGFVIQSKKLTYNDGSDVNIGIGTEQSGTLSTDLGGQYQVMLPDGTKVWLNSASRLSFSLNSDRSLTRNVELDGEAYFEVAKDKRRPFVVKTAQQEVHVLGTHFNVRSYNDEQKDITTLMEGSVQVLSAHDQVKTLLKPGFQGVLPMGRKTTVVPANIRQVLAWKNGLFRFNGERIDQIMLQLSKWYDIEVVYDGKIPEEEFSANISRSKNISEVLKMLSYSNDVNFKIEGRRVTVKK